MPLRCRSCQPIALWTLGQARNIEQATESTDEAIQKSGEALLAYLDIRCPQGSGGTGGCFGSPVCGRKDGSSVGEPMIPSREAIEAAQAVGVMYLADEWEERGVPVTITMSTESPLPPAPDYRQDLFAV